MWANLRQKIVSGSSSASLVWGQSMQANKPNFAQEWKFYTISVKEACFVGKDSTMLQNVRSHVSSCSKFSSKLVSGINSLKEGSHHPCERPRSFSTISVQVPMSRSMWKGPFLDAFLYRMKRRKENISNKKIWSRRSVILPEYVNCTVRIYDGKTFRAKKITEAMVGHKFGEFAMTRNRRRLKQISADKQKQNKMANKKKGKR